MGHVGWVRSIDDEETGVRDDVLQFSTLSILEDGGIIS